ncbi:CRISPR-associated nuclease/helicase Cas3 [Pseudoclavibacter triregionum]|nr:CRISPR-associated nuclease/helicase Cas3 [Pseudoclavibacter triregionum]
MSADITRAVLRHVAPPTGPCAELWAKSLEDGEIWMPLWRHLDDTAGVADLLWESRLSPGQRARLGRLVGDETLARRLSVWLAGAHDVGKASVAFAGKVPRLRARAEAAGFSFHAMSASAQRAAPHGIVGQLATEAWLADRGVRAGAATRLACVIGGHHGVYPTHAELRPTGGELEALREEAPEWRAARVELLDRAAEAAGLGADAFRILGSARLDAPAWSLLTGFIIVCDWIASNADLLPVHHRPEAPGRAERGLARLRLPAPWRPEPDEDAEALIRERFSLPPEASPRPSQLALVTAARELPAPGFLLLEAPTGEGKTEAALAAAEVLAARFGASGTMVALPTRATSDAMFSRVLDWLDRALGAGKPAAAVLSHGKAQFNDEYEGLSAAVSELAPVYDVDGAEAAARRAAVAHWWMRGRKTSALADFSVGTIDQLLFTALRSRHLSLRHLGAMDKIIVIDEIHAADTYMLTFLCRALEWLGAAGVCVVGLSATLPPARRLELLAAYERGARASGGDVLFDDEPPSPALSAEAAHTGYPIITASTADGARAIVCAPSSRTSEVRLELLGEDDEVLLRRIREEAQDGGCIAVVRNIVGRAQSTYSALIATFGPGEVTLLHSRFLDVDRRERERRIVASLGPSGCRPRRLIVVATQVIEQSLDLDFDLLVSDLAPIDLLLQRAGRLHRHTRPEGARPARLAQARMLLTGVEGLLDERSAPVLEGASKAVYGASALLRSASVLRRALLHGGGRISSPGDIAGLVRDAYAPDAEPPAGWRDAWSAADTEARLEAASQRERSGVFAIPAPGRAQITDLTRGNLGEASDEARGQAQVRDAGETLPVIAVQRVGGRLRSLPWLEEPFAGRLLDEAWIEDDLARAVARCGVALPEAAIRRAGGGIDALIERLESEGTAAWQESRWLRGELPLVFDEEMSVAVGRIRFSYDRDRGLSWAREEDLT